MGDFGGGGVRVRETGRGVEVRGWRGERRRGSEDEEGMESEKERERLGVWRVTGRRQREQAACSGAPRRERVPFPLKPSTLHPPP
eukprot:3738726-Rhodomonas_salina.2